MIAGLASWGGGFGEFVEGRICGHGERRDGWVFIGSSYIDDGR